MNIFLPSSAAISGGTSTPPRSCSSSGFIAVERNPRVTVRHFGGIHVAAVAHAADQETPATTPAPASRSAGPCTARARGGSFASDRSATKMPSTGIGATSKQPLQASWPRRRPRTPTAMPSTRPMSAPVCRARYCNRFSVVARRLNIKRCSAHLKPNFRIQFGSRLAVGDTAQTAPARKINQYTPISNTAATSGTPTTNSGFACGDDIRCGQRQRHDCRFGRSLRRSISSAAAALGIRCRACSCLHERRRVGNLAHIGLLIVRRRRKPLRRIVGRDRRFSVRLGVRQSSPSRWRQLPLRAPGPARRTPSGCGPVFTVSGSSCFQLRDRRLRPRADVARLLARHRQVAHHRLANVALLVRRLEHLHQPIEHRPIFPPRQDRESPGRRNPDCSSSSRIEASSRSRGTTPVFSSP